MTKAASRVFPILALASAALLGCSPPPRSEHAGHSGHAGQEVPPGEVPLFDDLGSHHHRVTTAVPAAQQYFDQGLRLVYGFNHDEAERAFREAARLDPSCAMAWWGVALALGPNINLPLDAERNRRALDAVGRARALEGGASEPERGYIEAVTVRYSADPAASRADLDRAYSRAMGELSRRFPEDDDAAVLHAESLMDLRPWQLWSADGKPAPGTGEIVQILEGVLARSPDHPGANHYYIHAVEASPDPGKASASAERLPNLVPGAGHLVHMPAHIHMRTGNYDGAVEANDRAARVDAAYIARVKPKGVYPLMYTTHNFMFLSAAAGMTGQSRQATESAAKAVAMAAPMAGHDAMAEYVLPASLFAMARSGKWEDVLAHPRPADATPSTLAFWHYARGLAHAARGALDEARRERRELAAAAGKVPADLKLNLNLARDLLEIASAVLDARLAGAAGRRDAAIGFWKAAVRVQDGLQYDEPPAWYYPVRESLGGEYLRAGRHREAAVVFRRDLELNPANPRSLFGLREALRGRSQPFDDAGRRFEEGWRKADITPPTIEDL